MEARLFTGQIGIHEQRGFLAEARISSGEVRSWARLAERFHPNFDLDRVAAELKIAAKEHGIAHVTRGIIFALRLSAVLEKQGKHHDKAATLLAMCFHDVAFGNPDTHAQEGADFMEPYLTSMLPPARAQEVCRIIRLHSSRGIEITPGDWALKIARDSDAADLPRMGVSPYEVELLLPESVRLFWRDSQELLARTRDATTSDEVIRAAESMGMLVSGDL